MSAQCAAPGEVMVPWNEPEVKPVAKVYQKLYGEAPYGSRERSVPPVMVFISVILFTPGVPDGSLDPANCRIDVVSIGRDQLSGACSSAIREVHCNLIGE
jgi:hypothetical protein